jgi:hypothetical protein
MEIAITKMIMAAVTCDEQKVHGVPVFYAKDKEDQERMATMLSRVMEAVAHDMGNGVYIIVKH